MNVRCVVEPFRGDLEKVALSMKRKKPRENWSIGLEVVHNEGGRELGACVRGLRLRKRLLCGLRRCLAILGVESGRVFR